jgi:BirA family biotin operon repressor/biotin-[acetyl-CoA-carboxylase] ligase
MTKPKSVWTLDTRRIGRQVHVFDVLDSTNNLAAALASDPANDGIVIVASRQTAGRGQHGRIWQSPTGTAVLLSVLCFPPPLVRRPAILTAWAAVSVCETVCEMVGNVATIKWPNDVLVQEQKICGILTEQGRGTVVGIGFNVNQLSADFEAGGLVEATSLRLIAGREFDCVEVARSLIGHLDEGYSRMVTGDLATLEERWRQCTGLIGLHVKAECADGVVRGRLLDMAFDGLLLDTGIETRLLAPELVRHVGPA